MVFFTSDILFVVACPTLAEVLNILKTVCTPQPASRGFRRGCYRQGGPVASIREVALPAPPDHGLWLSTHTQCASLSLFSIQGREFGVACLLLWYWCNQPHGCSRHHSNSLHPLGVFLELPSHIAFLYLFCSLFRMGGPLYHLAQHPFCLPFSVPSWITNAGSLKTTFFWIPLML